ncbi:hypothetical protein [Saccharothrix sp.]|uniref:hypothetical protein n=1 Tax=Saccharothrix sp. TaxID=1873460 RepID=UPI002810CDCE|nr:hypothetical protein [Saccharothrix sp.]
MTLPLFGDPAPGPDLDPHPGVPGEAWAADQFRGRGLRIGRNRTVHRAGFVLDERGVEIPAPDCHAGYFAAGRPWWQVYFPTTDPVDCGLCLDARRHSSAPQRLPGQLTLDLGDLSA